MKLNTRKAVWAFALAIAVTGSVTRMFAISQCPVNGQNQTPLASSGILVFNGTGTTWGDRTALEYVITNNLRLDYDTVDSACLNKMSVANLYAYKLLIIPGGNSITIGKNISTTATANIKTAVRTYGLHYLGVCAGAFLASWAGSSGYNDIYLLDNDIWFDLFRDSSCGTNNILLTSETLSLADGSTIAVYWEDGPQLTPQQGGPWGTVVAKYPNGQPAIIQGLAGKGWTLLQGVHPEAPRSWGCGSGCTCNFGNTTQAEDFAYSATLISAALNGTVLPHY
jgi:Biotin-protein ligase, N terminal